MSTGEMVGLAVAFLIAAGLFEAAREKGVLLQAFVVSFLVLVAVLIVASVIWFEFHKPYGM
jgi:high-affinity Fe2+/Pb2+ permease